MIKWLKRIGVASFLFFLIKGLIWVGIFFYIKSCNDDKKNKGRKLVPARSLSYCIA
jgi:hypothetical protein